jgi:hypothetical protein
MKLITVLITAFVFLVITSAFAQNYEWAKCMGGTADQYTNDMVIDNQSNVYIVGSFQGTNIDFDPGIGTANLSSAGMIDIFIAKYDSSGNYLWAKRIGGTSDDIAPRMKIDHLGNIYIAGWFQSTNVDFDPGSGTAILSSAGSTDIFFAKYDKDGNYVWAKRIGTSLGDGCHDIDVDYLGNIYITGYFYGTNTDFDPGPGTALLSSIGNSGDIFFAKYDSLGNYLWAKSIGGSSYEVGNGITTDNWGNVYLTGPFSGTNVDFDPGDGTAYLSSAGGYDVFFAKYDSSGNYQWAKGIGGTGEDIGGDIVVDSLSNIYIPCYFHGTNVDFDPGPGTSYLNSAGGFDIGLAKYDASGNYVWANRFGGPGDDYSGGILLDEDANIYLTGSFTGTNVDFDPGPNTAYLSSHGNLDIFFGKYNSLGEYLWAASIGGTGGDNGMGIALNSSKKIYISGGFSGTNVDFDPGSGTAYLSSAGGVDIYIAKYYTLSGPYLGQTPPGTVPVQFASGIIPSGAYSITFSPDGLECFFTQWLTTNTILTTKETNGEWPNPVVASFSGTYYDLEPHITPDGNRMFYGSWRPLSGTPPNSLHQWYLDKTDTGWSEPKSMDQPLRDLFMSYVSVANNGNLYYGTWDGTNGWICVSRFINGQYQQPERLSDSINILPITAHPFIAPDESYLIFDAVTKMPGYVHDLFISLRKLDGTWTKAISLGGNINTDIEESCAFVSRDGKYLFFYRSPNMMWVDASFLCRLGDCNNDGILDIGDIVYLINYVFYGGSEPILPSDVNKDDVIDIGDIVYLINYVFYNGPQPVCL